jgi:hypothetical protein
MPVVLVHKDEINQQADNRSTVINPTYSRSISVTSPQDKYTSKVVNVKAGPTKVCLLPFQKENPDDTESKRTTSK